MALVDAGRHPWPSEPSGRQPRHSERTRGAGRRGRAQGRAGRPRRRQANGAENKKAQFYTGQILYMKDQAGAGKEMMQAVLKGMAESPEKTALDLTLGTLLLDAASKQDRVEGALQLTRLAARARRWLRRLSARRSPPIFLEIFQNLA